jgi:hypothetical protein
VPQVSANQGVLITSPPTLTVTKIEKIAATLQIVRKLPLFHRLKAGTSEVLARLLFAPHRPKPSSPCASETVMQCMHEIVYRRWFPDASNGSDPGLWLRRFASCVKEFGIVCRPVRASKLR